MSLAKTCEKCVHWQRHWPNDGGVCWNKEAKSSVMGVWSTTTSSVGLGAIGDTLADMFGHGEPMLVTRYDAACAEHKEAP